MGSSSTSHFWGYFEQVPSSFWLLSFSSIKGDDYTCLRVFWSEGIHGLRLGIGISEQLSTSSVLNCKLQE